MGPSVPGRVRDGLRTSSSQGTLTPDTHRRTTVEGFALTVDGGGGGDGGEGGGLGIGGNDGGGEGGGGCVGVGGCGGARPSETRCDKVWGGAGGVVESRDVAAVALSIDVQGVRLPPSEGVSVHKAVPGTE